MVPFASAEPALCPAVLAAKGRLGQYQIGPAQSASNFAVAYARANELSVVQHEGEITRPQQTEFGYPKIS